MIGAHGARRGAALALAVYSLALGLWLGQAWWSRERQLAAAAQALAAARAGLSAAEQRTRGQLEALALAPAQGPLPRLSLAAWQAALQGIEQRPGVRSWSVQLSPGRAIARGGAQRLPLQMELGVAHGEQLLDSLAAIAALLGPQARIEQCRAQRRPAAEGLSLQCDLALWIDEVMP